MISLQNLYSNENQYYIPDGIIVKSNLIIISGCSGGGKSSLIAELARRGYSSNLEPGRQIVKEQLSIDGKALPWKDIDHFLELALSRYIFLFNRQEKSEKMVFFDRGIIDAVQLKRKQETHFHKAALKFRYHKRVFILPPWKEIYCHDSERKHSFSKAVEEYEEILIKYKKYDYEIILVPKDNVSKRADKILSYFN